MSGLARRRGNYDLADTMHGYAASWQHGSTDTASAEAQTPARLAVLSSALKIALAKAREAPVKSSAPERHAESVSGIRFVQKLCFAVPKSKSICVLGHRP